MLSNFCCCISLRSGVMIIAIIFFIRSIMLLVIYLSEDDDRNSMEFFADLVYHSNVRATILILSIACAIVAALLFLASRLENTLLLLPFLIYICAIVITSLYAFIIDIVKDRKLFYIACSILHTFWRLYSGFIALSYYFEIRSENEEGYT